MVMAAAIRMSLTPVSYRIAKNSSLMSLSAVSAECSWQQDVLAMAGAAADACTSIWVVL